MESEDWALIRDLAKQTHKERVAETPKRIEYVSKLFSEKGFEYKLKNKETGHFHVFDKDNNLFQFWCSTGKIYYDKKVKETKGFTKNSTDFRGVDTLIKLLQGDKKLSNPIKISEITTNTEQTYTKSWVIEKLKNIEGEIELATALQNDNGKVTFSAIKNILETEIRELENDNC